MADKLTTREALFVSEVIKGVAAEHAAVAAGWSKKYARKSAHLISKRPAVQAAIAEAQAKLKEQSEMSAEKLLQMFVEAYAKAMEWKQSTGAVRAGEMIGKLTGLIQDKLKLEIEPKVSLASAIDAGRARAGLPPRVPAEADIIDITPPSAPAKGG